VQCESPFNYAVEILLIVFLCQCDFGFLNKDQFFPCPVERSLQLSLDFFSSFSCYCSYSHVFLMALFVHALEASALYISTVCLRCLFKKIVLISQCGESNYFTFHVDRC